MGKHKIKLGVNIDHAATLRQVRGSTTNYPDLELMTQLVKKGGGHQITIHLREDRRHMQDADVVHLCKKSKLPINLEIAVSEEMLKIALKNKPAWVCFVPEKREELTTEGGLNIIKVFDEIKRMTGILKEPHTSPKDDRHSQFYLVRLLKRLGPRRHQDRCRHRRGIEPQLVR